MWRRGEESDVTLELHHRVPRSQGGTDHPDNLILIYKECHSRHHGNLPTEQAAVEAQQRARDADSGDRAAPGKSHTATEQSTASDPENDVRSLLQQAKAALEALQATL